MGSNATQVRIHLRGDYETRKVWLNGKALSPSKSTKVYNKSPDGFGWGYGGSGPSQLALAILLELLPKEHALTYFQDFKAQFIQGLPQTDVDQDLDLTEFWSDRYINIGEETA